MAKVEVFTAGCPICEKVVEQVRELVCPKCELIIYDLNKGCKSNICLDKAKELNIQSLPAVVVNGRLVDCCANRSVDPEKIRVAIQGE